MPKRYYWLKLPEDWFRQKPIKKLRKIASGDTYTIIYLKMLLVSLKQEGKIYFEGVENAFYEELALDLDEDPENVKVTVEFLLSQGLMELVNESEYNLPEARNLTGSGSDSAERVRRFRDNHKDTENVVQIEAKTNAERQKAYRAKKESETKRHIPLIEDYTNRKRYGGNYYIVIKRDGYKCALCGSTDNLCVHHIDGYSEQKPENNSVSKMITLCRECHSNVHANNIEIPYEKLEKIGYFNPQGVTCNVTCNDDVTVTLRNGNAEKEIEKEIEIEKDKEIDKTFCPERCSGPQPMVEIGPAAVDTVQEIDGGAGMMVEKAAGPSSEVFIQLPLNTGEMFDVTMDYVAEKKALYPAVDVEQELRKMRGWLDDNPVNRKTSRGIKRFINGWLTRAQDRSPRAGRKPVTRFDNFRSRDEDWSAIESALLASQNQEEQL